MPQESHALVMRSTRPRCSGGTGFSFVITRNAQNQWDSVLARSRNSSGSTTGPIPMICW